MRVLRALSALALAAALLAACGDDGGSSAVADGETVDIAMEDILYTPDSIEVAAGATVTFAFTNEGDVTHEAVIGDEALQEEHEAEMGEMAEDGTDDEMTDSTAMDEDMEGMDHNADNAVSLESGESGEITYTFEEAGTVLIACHEPGHYDAGMIVEVTVT